MMIVPSTMKASSLAWLNLFLGGIGSFGPLAVGYLNNLNPPYFDMKDNPLAIRWSLFFVSTIAYVSASFFSFIMFFFIQRDFKRLDDWYEENKLKETESEDIVI